jgi:hypothetical protein
MASNSREKISLHIISLDDEKTARSILWKMNHSTAVHQALRRKFFRQVARSAKLQHVILEILCNHGNVRKTLLLGVAGNPTLKRELLKVAGAVSEDRLSGRN